MYNHRHIFSKIPQLGPIEEFIDSIRRIKTISAKILEERTKDVIAIAATDSTLSGKKDILSLLVQSRMMDRTNGAGTGSKMIMSDEMMVEQVVCYRTSSFRKNSLKFMLVDVPRGGARDYSFWASMGEHGVFDVPLRSNLSITDPVAPCNAP